jgi:Zn-dependent peptidase ImmA (M78 family)
MINQEVQEVLDDVTRSAPVDVAAAAQRLGVKIFAAKLAEKVSGVLVRDPSYGTASGFVIFVDEDEPAVRQRFTAAHELGHFVLHKEAVGHKNEDNYLLRSDGMSNRQEAEANRFAAALLMPFDLVEDAMKSGITTPKDLAKHFKVSEIAMSIRLGLVT